MSKMVKMEAPQATDFARELADFAAQNWNPVERFLDSYDKIHRLAIRMTNTGVDPQVKALDGMNSDEVEAAVLLCLAQRHQKNVIGRMGEIAQSWPNDRRFWDVYKPFCDVLARLPKDYDLEDLADVLESLLPCLEKNLAMGHVYRGVKELAQASRETASSLLSTFARRSRSQVASFASSALLGLANFAPAEAHREAMELTKKVEPNLQRAGLSVLGQLCYSADDDLLQATAVRLADLREKRDPETTPMLASIYFKLLEALDEAPEALAQLAENAEPPTQQVMASKLLQLVRKGGCQAWHWRVLNSLATVPSDASHIVDKVDHCLAEYVSNEPQAVLKFLEAFVTARAYGREKETLPDLLSHTTSRLLEVSRSLLQEIVTQWFASTDHRLNQAAWDMAAWPLLKATEWDPEYPHLELSKSVLNSLDDESFVRTIRRVLGYGIHFQPLAALLTSALSRGPMPSGFGPPFEEILFKELLYSYPESGKKYLESRLTDEGLSDFERETIEKALAASEAYFATLEDLPRRRELQPPTHRLARIHRTMQERQTLFMERSRQGSPLLSIFPPIPIKYGKKAFRAQPDSFSEPIKMQTIAMSIETSRQAVIEPVRERRERFLHRCTNPQGKAE